MNPLHKKNTNGLSSTCCYEGSATGRESRDDRLDLISNPPLPRPACRFVRTGNRQLTFVNAIGSRRKPVASGCPCLLYNDSRRTRHPRAELDACSLASLAFFFSLFLFVFCSLQACLTPDEFLFSVFSTCKLLLSVLYSSPLRFRRTFLRELRKEIVLSVFLFSFLLAFREELLLLCRSRLFFFFFLKPNEGHFATDTGLIQYRLVDAAFTASGAAGNKVFTYLKF